MEVDIEGVEVAVTVDVGEVTVMVLVCVVGSDVVNVVVCVTDWVTVVPPVHPGINA